jgi:hypothetical protein
MSEKLKIVISNGYTTLERKETLSKTAKNIEAYIIYNIDSVNDQKFPVVTITRDVLKRLGIKSAFKREILSAVLELRRHEVAFTNKKGQRVDTSLCAAVTTIKEGYEYQLSFHPDLKPELLNIKTMFTKVSMDLLLSIGEDSEYTYNLYLILKAACDKEKYKNAKRGITLKEYKLNIDYKELRGSLGVGEKYPTPAEFARNAIFRARKELNKKTDLKILAYESTKNGKYVTGYSFLVMEQEYQPEFFELFNEPQKGTIRQPKELSKNLLSKLDDFAYKPTGKSKDFILDLLETYEERMLIQGLDRLYQEVKGLSDKIKGGSVKNRLVTYINKQVSEDNSQREISALNLEKNLEENAKKSYLKLLESKIEEFYTFHADEVNIIKNCLLTEQASYYKDAPESLLKSIVHAEVSEIVVEQVGSEATYIKNNITGK